MPDLTPQARSLLVIGGARSGKSRFAQAQAEASGLDKIYVATAEARDAEMRERIAAHVAARGAGWRTIETPHDLTAVLRTESGPKTILLVDCLTLWLSNAMLEGDDIDAATEMLSEAAASLAGPAIFVTNEVGSGIVPENALARRFRDAQGRLNQRMASVCTDVVLISAGLPLVLKPARPPDLAFSF